MITPDDFCSAFIKAYREAQSCLTPEAWKAVWNDDYETWNSLMLWGSPHLRERKSVLSLVAESLGVRYWVGEPFRCDAAFLPASARIYGRTPTSMAAVIEHESDLRTFREEIAKLLQIRCPLKVGITYALEGTTGPGKKLTASRRKITEHASALDAELRNLVREDARASYLYLLGVSPQKYKFEWHSLVFPASAGPASGEWRVLAA